MVLNDAAKQEFEIILELVLQNEKDDGSKGSEKTNSGITQKLYDSQQQKLSKKQGTQLQNLDFNISDLTKQDIYNYYLNEYTRNNIDKISNPNLRYVVFDTQISQDSQFATKMLQRVLKQQQDGILGKQALSTLNQKGEKEMLQLLITERRKLMEKNSANRLNKIEKQISGDGVIKNQQIALQKFNSIAKQKGKQENDAPKINMEQLQRIKGVDKLSAKFIIDNQENILLSDLATVLSVYYNPTLKDQEKAICFSLDPILTPNKQEFTEQEKVCYPDKFVNKNIIADTEFAKVLFESDYILKLMSLGVDKDGHSQFQYPEELAKIGLKPCMSFAQETKQEISMLCRFWLVPEKCSYTITETTYTIDDITIVCQARQIERVNNQLQDKVNQNKEDYSYQFAQKFTELYDQIARYYPVLSRLKQLFKAVALGKWMYENRIKMDYAQLIKYSKKTNNAPKFIPIIKFEEKQQENKTPVYFTKEEKLMKATEYLIEQGHPTTQEYIDQIVKQIPDLKGYQTSQQVLFTQGGIDPNCRNMVESKPLKLEICESKNNRQEVDIPFFPNIKCKDCSRWVENNLVSLNQEKCSIHNDYTCYLCLELLTQHDKDPTCCSINNYKYIFHKACFDEFQASVQAKDQLP